MLFIIFFPQNFSYHIFFYHILKISKILIIFFYHISRILSYFLLEIRVTWYKYSLFFLWEFLGDATTPLFKFMGFGTKKTIWTSSQPVTSPTTRLNFHGIFINYRWIRSKYPHSSFYIFLPAGVFKAHEPKFVYIGLFWNIMKITFENRLSTIGVGDLKRTQRLLD